MPVALDKMPVVGGGTVDVSRPNDSGLHSLANALGVAVQSAAEIGQVAQANELNRINALMNDATAGPDEIAEIAENAYFPLNKYAAKNRIGEAIIAQNRTAIEDDLASANDPVEARERLRAQQQRLAENVNDPAVLVGIREGIAALAPGALNEASRRRRETLNLQKRQAESIIFSDAYTAPESFATAVNNAVYDQTLADPTKVHEVHDTAAQTLLNTMIEDPGSISAVKASAYAAIEATEMSANDRAKYTAVIHAAHVYERANNEKTTTKARQEAAFDAASRRVIDAMSSGRVPNPADIRLVRELTPNPFATDSALSSFTDRLRNRPTGMLSSTMADDARKQLEAELKGAKDEFGINKLYTSEDLTVALRGFDSLMERLDPSLVVTDPAEARKQVALAQEAAKSHVQHFQETRAVYQEKRIKAEAKKQELFKQLETATEADLSQIEDNLRRLEGFLQTSEYDALLSELYEDAEELGVDLIDLRH